MKPQDSQELHIPLGGLSSLFQSPLSVYMCFVVLCFVIVIDLELNLI